MSVKTIVIFIVVTLGILVGVGGLLWQFERTSEKPIADIAGEMRHKQGEGSIVVTEFSDFQCPGCREVNAPLKEIMNQYQGKVQLAYRYFPLTNIHKNAQVSAQAAEAAGIQGKFWEMHDVLFKRQSEWEGLPSPMDKFVEYAKELGIDEQKFVSDMESQTTKDIIAQDVLAATKYRLVGTPSFFVDGVAVEFGKLGVKLAEIAK
ncbi:MAG: thioredoxin domain-containing protein [bacterium]